MASSTSGPAEMIFFVFMLYPPRLPASEGTEHDAYGFRGFSPVLSRTLQRQRVGQLRQRSRQLSCCRQSAQQSARPISRQT